MMFRELHPGFATEVVGLDVGVPLPDATVAALQDAIDAAGVLSYRPGIALRLPPSPSSSTYFGSGF